MTEAQQAVDAAIKEAERLRQVLHKEIAKQVSGDDNRRVIKATALTWFNNHRLRVVAVLNTDALAQIDEGYKALLSASERATTRARYLGWLKQIKRDLAQAQSDHVVALSAPPLV